MLQADCPRRVHKVATPLMTKRAKIRIVDQCLPYCYVGLKERCHTVTCVTAHKSAGHDDAVRNYSLPCGYASHQVTEQTMERKLFGQQLGCFVVVWHSTSHSPVITFCPPSNKAHHLINSSLPVCSRLAPFLARRNTIKVNNEVCYIIT